MLKFAGHGPGMDKLLIANMNKLPPTFQALARRARTQARTRTYTYMEIDWEKNDIPSDTFS
jgi:hypothetical protein